MLKVVVLILVGFGTVGLLVYTGLTFRDTIGRSTGTRQEALVRRQRFGLLGVLGLPLLVGAAWLLDIPLRRMWWLFAIGVLQGISLVFATIQLRREPDEGSAR
jgi:putative copper export protein